MINKIISFIKRNLLSVILVIILIFLISDKLNINSGVRPMASMEDSYQTVGVFNGKAAPSRLTGLQEPYAPTPEITDRKMITNTSFSLQVKNVTEVVGSIKTKVAELKGYVVDIYLSRPEVGESATITFRVPTDTLDNVTAYLRSQAIKVVSENISGNDITDQYVDIQERLDRLDATKKRFIEILASAKTVEEILNVQNHIFNIQSQIDNYKGQLKYMDSASSTSLVTAFLSTDEAGLPYTEPLSWRPEIIFKHAVRSLIGTLQGLGTAMIWLGVYSVVIVPAITILLIVIIVRKRAHKNQQ